MLVGAEHTRISVGVVHYHVFIVLFDGVPIELYVISLASQVPVRIFVQQGHLVGPCLQLLGSVRDAEPFVLLVSPHDLVEVV